MTRWVMVADLERCVGCQTCTAACRHANATPPAVQWRKVLDVEAGSYPNVSRTFVPVGCQHCANPPCLDVCPTTATRQRADGIVTVDYDLCIGCAYCEVACPYQARFLVHESHYAYDGAMPNEVERSDPARTGVAQKCTFCVDRIDFGMDNGLTPGLDPRATPACVNSCIADALHFGDIDDPDSNVSRLLKEQHGFRMHAELETVPGFYYLYGKSTDPTAEGETAAPKNAATPGQLRTKGFEPSLQQHWNWKAAGNFVCGGMGGGLYAFSAIAALVYPSVIIVGWPALAIVALGLFLVLLKIGRPLRFMYVLRHRRSWMTREAWIAGVFFPIAALALWSARPSLLIASAIIALLFVYSQAMILMRAKGIPVWRTRWIVPLMMTTSLAEGSALFLAACAAGNLLGQPGLELVAVVAVTLTALRGLVWRGYCRALKADGAPTRSLAVLKALQPSFFALGLLLPVLLILAGYAHLNHLLFGVAGVSIAAAGGGLKLILVTEAAFNQGFALVHTPVRGSGSAGPAVKPGWSMG